MHGAVLKEIMSVVYGDKISGEIADANKTLFIHYNLAFNNLNL